MIHANAHSRNAGPSAGSDARPDERTESASRWLTPSVEVISLSCEISAYAPDEDGWPPF